VRRRNAGRTVSGRLWGCRTLGSRWKISLLLRILQHPCSWKNRVSFRLPAVNVNTSYVIFNTFHELRLWLEALMNITTAPGSRIGKVLETSMNPDSAENFFSRFARSLSYTDPDHSQIALFGTCGLPGGPLRDPRFDKGPDPVDELLDILGLYVHFTRAGDFGHQSFAA
jgi:hypothetical protein